MSENKKPAEGKKKSFLYTIANTTVFCKIRW